MPPIVSKLWSMVKAFLAAAEGVLQKQRSLIVAAVAAGILLLGAAIMIPRIIRMADSRKPNLSADSSRTLNNALEPLGMPQEDFFLPDEPDFLPEVLFEQPPRDRWTPEDVRPFWRVLEEDSENQRERIETAIDELLKGVP